MATGQQHREFAKELGLKEVMAIAIGAMIGGGIFTVLGRLAGLAGPFSMFSFFLGGLISFLTAHSYVKLISKYPSAGGEFVILRRGFNNKIFGNSIGALLWLGYSVTIALYAFTFGLYVAEWFFSITGIHFFNPANIGFFSFRRLMAALAIFTFMIINLWGVKETGLIQNIIVYFKLGVLLLFALVGLAFISGQNYIDSWTRALKITGNEFSALFNGIFVGGAVIFVAYEGFQVIANTVEELKNPSRDVKIGMYVSVIVVCFTYMAVSFVAIGLVKGVITEAALIQAVEFLGPIAVTLITLGAIASTTSAINATLLGSSRLAFVMSEWAAFPKTLARISKTRKVPYLAIIITSMISLSFTFLGDANAIAEVASIIFLGIFLFINASAILIYPNDKNWLSKLGVILIISDIILAFYYLLFENTKGTVFTLTVLAIFITVTVIWMLANQYLLKGKSIDEAAYRLAPLGADLITEFHYSDSSDAFFTDLDNMLLPVAGKVYETQNILVSAYIAKKYNVKITLLHVGNNEYAFNTAESIFNDFKITYEKKIKPGNHIASQICQTYNEGNYQLISLSSRRKHRFPERLFEKSVSFEVVNNVDCTVLQVHPPRYGQKEREIGDLFLLFDGSERDAYIARWGKLISSIGMKSKVTAYHVLSLPEIFPLDEAPNISSITNSKMIFEKYSIELGKRFGLNLKPYFMYGHSKVNTIAGQTEIYEPDAIIMGHTKDKGLRYRLRTPLAYRIMNKVNCAVIVHHTPNKNGFRTKK
ncbi:MAG: universal stress protein [Candidatus Thorarchaeota archaeon]